LKGLRCVELDLTAGDRAAVRISLEMVQASSANAASTICKGAVALMWIVTREIESWPVPLSDGSCEFGERGHDAPMLSCFAAEFVVTGPRLVVHSL
jgi:hypothetical protein